MPDPLPRIITRKELRQIVPFSPQYILKLEKRKQFPERISIGKRRVGWWLHKVLEWVAEREANGNAVRTEDAEKP